MERGVEKGPLERAAPDQAEEVDAGVRIQDEGCEALGRPIDGGEMQDAAISADDLALLADVGDGAVAQHHPGIGIQNPNRLREIFGQETIVVGEPLEISAASESEGAVVIRRGTEIVLVAQVTHPPIRGGEVARNLGRAVGGSVVRDDQLPILERLRENRTDRFLEISFSVENRQTHGNQRCCCFGQGSSRFDAAFRFGCCLSCSRPSGEGRSTRRCARLSDRERP
ncbi:MAG: hypothetical protein NZP72_03375 [Geminicoccaceae bacterium]|nr:hypothetical protein [Geminicoccaceae bacterium]